MKQFGNLAIYLGIGFLLSFIINHAYIYLYVSIAMFVIGIIIHLINSRK